MQFSVTWIYEYDVGKMKRNLIIELLFSTKKLIRLQKAQPELIEWSGILDIYLSAESSQKGQQICMQKNLCIRYLSPHSKCTRL